MATCLTVIPPSPITLPPSLRQWRFITSPPLSGRETMRVDVDLLNGVERGALPPTLRFFRFKEPTVSYGRLQKLADIVPLVPTGWEAVQRPTGGGIVFHNGDLCLSLAWRDGGSPLPRRPREQYRWIHAVILEVLMEVKGLRMAGCGDVSPPHEPFGKRACFKNPVGYDLMHEQKKIVGGALCCTRQTTLYQGSIQLALTPAQEAHLLSVFQSHFDTNYKL
jgi:lipoate-protein ligase A